jgi:hypothetical protein
MVDNVPLSWRKWKKRITILFVFIPTVGVICAGCIHQEQGAETAVAWEDYFRGDFAVTGEPVLNQEVKMLFTVNPVLEAPNTSITLYLPEGIELVQGDSNWKGDIKKDELVQVRITVKPIQEGQWIMWFYVESVFSSRRKEHCTYYLVFLTSKDSGQVSRTHFYPPSPEGGTVAIPVHLSPKSVPRPNVGEEVVLTFLLTASEDVPNVKAVIVLPEEFIFIDGILEWTGDLKAGQEETLQITIKTTERGRFKILGILTYDDEEWKYATYIFVH